jgi:2-(1,2-epoxy-1,2-dihydrophenyl)acetyl-CoA isomerase
LRTAHANLGTYDQQTVLVSIEDSVAWVTLNRPAVLNAMNVALMDELRAALVAVAEDDAVRCVVLRGAGRSFSAGGDVAMMAERQRFTLETKSSGGHVHAQQRDLVRRGEASVLLHTMPKPTIAMLHGHVLGGGAALAFAADLRVAAVDTKIKIGFAARALSGDFGITYLLDRSVGPLRARELLLLDPELTSEEAKRMGLVTMVRPNEDLMSTTRELAAKLAAGPTIAYARMKANLEAIAASPKIGESLVIEALNQRVSALTQDCAESGAAFTERRPPHFIGG